MLPIHSIFLNSDCHSPSRFPLLASQGSLELGPRKIFSFHSAPVSHLSFMITSFYSINANATWNMNVQYHVIWKQENNEYVHAWNWAKFTLQVSDNSPPQQKVHLRKQNQRYFWMWFIEKVLSWFPEIIHFSLSGKYDFVFLPIIFLQFVLPYRKIKTRWWENLLFFCKFFPIFFGKCVVLDF